MPIDKKHARAEKKAEKKQQKLKKSRAFAMQHSSDLRKSRYESDFNDRKSLHPVWQLGSMDMESKEWGWGHLTIQTWLDILQKLKNFETMTWGQIESGDSNDKSHIIWLKDAPNPEIKKRLQILKLDDIDQLFSLRLSGKERIYGILYLNTLKLLWYDPTHSVWAVEKKHT